MSSYLLYLALACCNEREREGEKERNPYTNFQTLYLLYFALACCNERERERERERARKREILTQIFKPCQEDRLTFLRTLSNLNIHIRVICEVRVSSPSLSPPYPLFQWYLQSKEIL